LPLPGMSAASGSQSCMDGGRNAFRQMLAANTNEALSRK
jgi:hypothetical protein